MSIFLSFNRYDTLLFYSAQCILKVVRKTKRPLFRHRKRDHKLYTGLFHYLPAVSAKFAAIRIYSAAAGAGDSFVGEKDSVL